MWHVRSPFVAAAACEAFAAAGEHEQAEPLVRYLRDTREPDGSWMFDPHERRWPPDADSTACALAALSLFGEISSTPLRRIIDEQPGDNGLIRPWLHWHPGADERLDRNAPDAIVTANVVFAAHRLGEECRELERALQASLREGAASVYYVSPHVRAYYLARALGTGETAHALGGREPWFTDPAGYHWRSRMFSTALAVETLARQGRSTTT